MPVNNMFSTWFNSWFGTGFGVGTGWWNNNWFQNPAQTKTTKQEKFPWLNQQQIANIEKYTANLTWAEKKQEQQKIYQAMIQAIEAENFNDSRTAMENERYRNSLSKTDPRECKFDQSACRQSALVDLVKDARNLKANTDENTVMQMFMQEMDYRGIGMDKLNAYLDSGDESILYETWLKTQREAVQWKSIQQWWVRSLINPASEWWILPESKSEWRNPIGAAAETVDNAANKFADKFTVTWEKATNNLANKIQNMSKKEVAQYRKQYEKLLKDKDWRVGRVQGDTIVEQLWNGIKWNISYDYNDKDFMEWLVSQKANLWESLIWADDILKWETNPNVIQFFGNIPSSAVKTFTATVRGMTNPYDTMKWLYKLAATEEWHQALLNRYGSWDALAKAMNTDPVWVADDVLAVAELGTNIAKWWLKFTWKVTWNQSLANMANNIPTIWSANDALAQKTVWGIYGWLDKFADMTDSKLVKWAVRYAEDVSSIQKATENAGKDLKAIEESSVGQAVKNAKDEFINKLVGIDEADREFIQNNKEIVNEYLDWKKNVETVFDDVKEKISEKRLKNTEMGQEYEVIRKNKKKVVNTQWITNDMKKTLKKNKITIDEDWNLKFGEMNKFNDKQKAALIDAWSELKKVENAKNINAWDVLDMRQKFDDKLNWDGKAMDLNWNLSAVDKATEWLIQDMRWVIDERAKTSVAWLKKLDAKYAEAMAEMQQIKKDWLNPDGTFKDNARSKLRNLTKAWNEEKLARLENVIPWITQDLKALDVWLTVEKASKQWVWQYSKSIVWWGIPSTLWAAFVNPVAWVVSWLATAGLLILTTPKNYVKLVEAYPDIVAKLQAWQELLPSDMAKLQSLASRIQDWTEE